MSFLDKNNKFVTYLIILVALFIVVLFTRGQISLLQENLETTESREITLEQKRDKIEELNNKKAELESADSGIDKYLKEFKEDEIIDYIYSYIENINSVDEGITIVRSLSFSEGQLNEMGFTESTINLQLRVPSEEKMKNILDFLTSTDSEYNFYIESFTYPRGDINGSFNITVPLKVLYK